MYLVSAQNHAEDMVFYHQCLHNTTWDVTWEIGSVWVETVGQEEVGWYTQMENSTAVSGLGCENPSAGPFLLFYVQMELENSDLTS